MLYKERSVAWFSEVLLIQMIKFRYLEGTAALDTFEESHCDYLSS